MNGFKGSLIEVSKNLDKLKLFFTFLKDDPGTARKQFFHFRPCVVIYTKIPMAKFLKRAFNFVFRVAIYERFNFQNNDRSFES